jgi:hypothetical protein
MGQREHADADIAEDLMYLRYYLEMEYKETPTDAMMAAVRTMLRGVWQKGADNERAKKRERWEDEVTPACSIHDGVVSRIRAATNKNFPAPRNRVKE